MSCLGSGRELCLKPSGLGGSSDGCLARFGLIGHGQRSSRGMITCTGNKAECIVRSKKSGSRPIAEAKSCGKISPAIWCLIDKASSLNFDTRKQQQHFSIDIFPSVLIHIPLSQQTQSSAILPIPLISYWPAKRTYSSPWSRQSRHLTTKRANCTPSRRSTTA
jgi:hypothetical protein